MSSAGFGSNEHLNSVDPAEIEQLQLNLNTDFDGLQTSNTHAVPSNVLLRSKCGIGVRCKPELEQETNTVGVIPQPESIPSMWPKYIENQTYSSNDYQPVDIRCVRMF